MVCSPESQGGALEYNQELWAALAALKQGRVGSGDGRGSGAAGVEGK